MKIGTLSFGRVGDDFDLGSERREKIANLAKKRGAKGVELLVCAGHAVESRKDVDWLADRVKRANIRMNILTETQFDRLDHDQSGASYHIMYWLDSSGNVSILGKQHFARSSELNGDDGIEMLGNFERVIDSRIVDFAENYKIFTLCCGELNILLGRNGVTCRSEAARKKIESATIILNPTHDRMGNGGTLNAKRGWLSGNGRVAVSVSNWDHSEGQPRGQQGPSETLHTVYQDGQRLKLVDSEGGKSCGYVYREWEVDLK